MQQDKINVINNYEGYIKLLKARLEKEDEINDSKNINIEKFFAKLGFTAFLCLSILISLSISVHIILTPTLAVLSFFTPTVIFGLELGIKELRFKKMIKEINYKIKCNYPNINIEITNEQLIDILNEVKYEYIKHEEENIINDECKVIQYIDYVNENEKNKVRKLIK